VEKELKKSIMPDYIASMSHDLRNRLHGILSFSNFGIKKIDENKATEEKLKHYYTSIKESGTRLLNLLNNIVDLAKLESGRMPVTLQERNLTTVVKGVIAELYPILSQQAQSIKLAETENQTISEIDVKLLGQAIKNLFVQVMTNSSANDIIEAEVSTVDQNLDKSDSMPMVKFKLRDQSADYSDEAVNRYFDLMLNPDDKASDDRGLGLTISKMIIEMHRGRLWAEACPEGGVDVCFVIPGMV